MPSGAVVNCMGGSLHNPRGNFWMNDDSTFGHKLLMKMGWSQGKGLGKNEDGIKEYVKVKFKNTFSGLGWKEESFNKIQNIEYDSLLQHISEKSNSSSSNQEKCKGNFHARSQAFGKRLLYPKFMKQKDITNYSKKDMKSIFMSDSTSMSKMVKKDKMRGSSSKRDFISLSKEMDACNVDLGISDCFSEKIQEKKGKMGRSSKRKQKGSPDSKIKAFSYQVESQEKYSFEVIEPHKKDDINYSSLSKMAKVNSRDNLVVPCAKNLELSLDVDDFAVSANSFGDKEKEQCQIRNLKKDENIVPSGEKFELKDPNVENEVLLKSLANNSWVESQRQALKMKMYKNMLVCIKKHKILRTCNLLSIRGYGN